MTDEPGAKAPDQTDRWERQLVERVVMTSLTESRRARRWGIFFKTLTFAYLVVLLVLLLPEGWLEKAKKSDGHTGLVEIKGLITPGGDGNADKVVTGLRDAFEDESTKGVILRINSPGGSPVQAAYINDEIRRLRAKHPDTPLYAVIADVCASGGYYVAVAADKIYADKGSIVGSIGVRMDSFGFVDILDEFGVERRLLTAGARKAILDPFTPMDPQDRAHIQTLLNALHEQFIGVVRDGRGDRLANSDELFSGLFWTGEKSVELGLVDGLGSTSYVARELIGAEEIVDFTPEDDLLDRLADRIGAGIAQGLAQLGLGTGTVSLR